MAVEGKTGETSPSQLETLSLSDITSWDEHYDNPKAEIVLVSEDRVGFRVDAWQFKKHSSFIRDLMKFPSNQALELSPFELDFDSKIVRYFIDFVMAHSSSTAQISMTEFAQLFELTDKFMMEKVDKTLMVAMGLRVQQRPTPKDLDPWTVFKFAANRDNTELARACILAFEGAGVDRVDIFEAIVSKFDGIPGKYIAGLLLAGFDKTVPFNPNAWSTPDITVRMRTWDVVAEHFDVE